MTFDHMDFHHWLWQWLMVVVFVPVCVWKRRMFVAMMMS